VFLTADQKVRLGDFGISRPLDQTGDLATSIVGTPYYLSPEIVKGDAYGFKSDMWALGVILYEMCELKPPFTASSLAGVVVKITEG
jgi:serine/threonine protein kinase